MAIGVVVGDLAYEIWDVNRNFLLDNFPKASSLKHIWGVIVFFWPK